MSTFTVSFREPKIISLKKQTNKYGQPTKIVVVLDWSYMGKGIHTIYKKGNQYVWTDKQSPIPVRKFNNIESLVWEYELPQTLKNEIEKLK